MLYQKSMENSTSYSLLYISPELNDLAYKLYELMKEFNYTPSQMKEAMNIAIHLWENESSNFISSANY